MRYYVNYGKIIKYYTIKGVLYEKENVYAFIAAFKHDSAILINNFLRKHTNEQYRKGQFSNFDFTTGGLDFNDWGDPILALEIIHYMSENESSYWGIDVGYIEMLMHFAEYMSEQPPLTNPMVVYRGCNSLEDDGVSGLVSTSTDKKIAEQFDRGTLLKINLPKGMKIVDVERTRPQKSKIDIEHEIILPPCEYKIKSDEEMNLRGPNNHKGKTRVVEIDVQPKDLLREFALAMDNPVKDYLKDYGIDSEYKKAYMYLLIMLERRAIDGCDASQKIRGTGLYGKTDVAKRDNMYKTNYNTKTNMYNAFSLMNSNQGLPDHMLQSMKQIAINGHSDIPDQITTRQFFDYVKKSKGRHVFYDYENTNEHERFYQYEDHGIRHADNVTMFTYYIASKEGYSNDGIRILMEAARYHDIGRINSWQEGGHGFAGAKRYASEHRQQIPISEQQVIGFLIQAHDLPNKEDIRLLANRMFEHYYDEEEINRICDMANIIRDADALDRTRFPIYSRDYLDSGLLTHDSARELIEVAQTINYRENLRSKGEISNNKSNKKRNSGDGHEEK